MQQEQSYRFRPIRPEDNPRVAHIIRTVMTEFGAVGPGYSIEDPEVDYMFETYNSDRAIFYVLEKSGEVVGCGGLAPLKGGNPDTCELQKMYFLEAGRGLGAGKELIRMLFDDARRLGFAQMYLETIEEMEAANGLYVKMGFNPIEGPMGNTGHSSCGRFYLKQM